MNVTEHLLTVLGEECAEVIKEISKANRFGLDDSVPGTSGPTNREKIAHELCDMLGVLTILEERGIIVRPANSHTLIAAKRAKVERFMQYARERGTLID